MAEPGTVVRRHTLVAAAWPHGAIVSDNTLDSYVRRLRAKLEQLDQLPDLDRPRGRLPVAVRPASLRARMAATALLVSTLTAAGARGRRPGPAGQEQRRARPTPVSPPAAPRPRPRSSSRTGRVRILEQRATVLDQNVWIFDDRRAAPGRHARPAGSLGAEVTALSDSTTERQVTQRRRVAAGAPGRARRRAGRDGGGRRGPRALRGSPSGTPCGSRCCSVPSTVVVATAARPGSPPAGRCARCRRWPTWPTTGASTTPRARFDPGPGGDEIAHLGRTLDRMLDRIGDALAAERRLTDEIAHELRTPLAVVLAEADLARRSATPDAARESRRHPRRRAADARLHRHDARRGRAPHAGSDDRATVGELMATLGLDRDAVRRRGAGRTRRPAGRGGPAAPRQRRAPRRRRPAGRGDPRRPDHGDRGRSTTGRECRRTTSRPSSPPGHTTSADGSRPRARPGPADGAGRRGRPGRLPRPRRSVRGAGPGSLSGPPASGSWQVRVPAPWGVSICTPESRRRRLPLAPGGAMRGGRPLGRSDPPSRRAPILAGVRRCGSGARAQLASRPRTTRRPTDIRARSAVSSEQISLEDGGGPV